MRRRPYKSVEDYIGAVKKAPPGQYKMGGTGSRQEDQIITVAIEKSAGVKFTYIPFRGGGEVAVQLVGNHVNSTVNNPNEAMAQWRGGKVRPLCVFDGKPLPYTETVVDKLSWSSIPTCKSQGLNMEYLMLRGIFMSPGATPEQVNFYVELFKKVRETPEWKKLMSRRRLQPDLHDRRRIRQMGRRRRAAPSRADERGRLPRASNTIADHPPAERSAGGVTATAESS